LWSDQSITQVFVANRFLRREKKIMTMDSNPIGTDGFEFVEFTGPDPALLHKQFEQLGFRVAGRHRSKQVTHYRQGDINFILNAEPNSDAEAFGKKHGNSANAMAFRVTDAGAALQEAERRGAQIVQPKVGPMELSIPAIIGIGGLHIYLVDRYGAQSIYDVDFEPVDGAEATSTADAGLTYIDHLTHNLARGNMARWAKFYEDVFNFREIRFFDIEGQHTGLFSKAMTSPCGKIRIPLNESQDDQSQIEEFLRRYEGEGIQHIALGTDDIFQSVSALKDKGVPFQSTPDTYYGGIDARVPGHGEDIARLKALQILIDGAPQQDQGLLLQIFTQDAIGPIFFEIIQRKGNEGFGEGNFKALFESIEQDQVRRGVLNVEED
jgi:4-hydroxyphenylpyruvate dioxygenase